MFRTDATDNVGVKPAYTAIGTPGFHTGGPPGTVLTHEVMNHVQEELSELVETIGGIALDKADDNQIWPILYSVRGIRSGNQCGTVASPEDTPDLTAQVATTGCWVDSTLSAVIASANGGIGAGGGNSFLLGTNNASVTGAIGFSGVLAGEGDVSGGNSLAMACDVGPTVVGDACLVAASTGGSILGAHNVALGCDYDGGNPYYAAGPEYSAMLGSVDCFASSAAARQRVGFLSALDCFSTSGSGQAYIASEDCSSTMALGAIIASDDCTGAGVENVTAACGSVANGGTNSAVIASVVGTGAPSNLGHQTAIIASIGDCTANASVDAGAIIACSSTTGLDLLLSVGAVHMGSAGACQLNGNYLVSLGSDWGAAGLLINADANCVLGGTAGAKTWRLQSTTGVGHLNGGTAVGADYAELFELETPGTPLLDGALVAGVGRKVRLAAPGDRVRGVVSAAPSLLGNAAENGWKGRDDRDRWGRTRFVEELRVSWPRIKPTIERPTEDCIRWHGSPARDEPTAVRHVAWGYRGTKAAAPLPIPPHAREFTFEGVERLEWYDYDGPLADAPEPIPVDAWLWLVTGPTLHVPAVVGYDGPVEDAPGVPDGMRATSYKIKLAEIVVDPGRPGFDGLEGDAPDEIPEDANRWRSMVPQAAPGLDRGLVSDYTPRTERPGEWCPVGLVGQLRVRVGASVAVGDFAQPGADGVADATSDGEPAKGRPVEVLEVTRPYDATDGYAIALCLVG